MCNVFSITKFLNTKIIITISYASVWICVISYNVSCYHHNLHLFDGFIGEFTGQLNAVANSALFDSVPNTLSRKHSNSMLSMQFCLPDGTRTMWACTDTSTQTIRGIC